MNFKLLNIDSITIPIFVVSIKIKNEGVKDSDE